MSRSARDPLTYERLADELAAAREHIAWLERELERERREKGLLKAIAQDRSHQIRALGGVPVDEA